MQLRLLACHVGGVLLAAAAIPYLLAAGWRIDNIVVASILGFVAFLLLAALGGYLLRKTLARWPVRSAMATPVAALAAIYLLVRALDGFAAEGARLAFEAAMIGGLAALASSALRLAWIAASRSPQREA